MQAEFQDYNLLHLLCLCKMMFWLHNLVCWGIPSSISPCMKNSRLSSSTSYAAYPSETLAPNQMETPSLSVVTNQNLNSSDPWLTNILSIASSNTQSQPGNLYNKLVNLNVIRNTKAILLLPQVCTIGLSRFNFQIPYMKLVLFPTIYSTLLIHFKLCCKTWEFDTAKLRVF